MKFTRRLTHDRWEYDEIEWDVRPSSIPGANFYMPEVEVPKHWSQTATDILAQKYFRKTGVTFDLGRTEVKGMPQWLWPCLDTQVEPESGETSAKQVFHRIVGCWTYWGWLEGIFAGDEESAKIFYDELFFMLAMQYGAPNSPQWFNTGLHWAYGIKGPDTGQWTIDNETKKIVRSHNSYERPQVHACYIQPVADDLVNPGGMLDLWQREARLFKHGSGSGTNFSSIRSKGEPIAGGGKSSGLMSFLRVGDSSAGSIKSGGTTRRAAKMCVLDLDHPEIEQFVDWKLNEEYKAAAMHVGSQVLRNYFMEIGDPKTDPFVATPDAVIDRMKVGFEPEILTINGLEAEAIKSVDGQNSNNTVRVPDAFLNCVDNGETWNLTQRTNKDNVVNKVQAKDLWQKISRAAWACGDPGLQFSDTINSWHTCSADGSINASNPCSEFLFLDNTACNLASLNLCKFLSPEQIFEIEIFEHAVRLWTVVLEISVYMASYPSREIAQGSRVYRPLGLGYANLAAVLRRQNFRYSSAEGRVFAGGVTALMHFAAYKISNELAAELGPFPRYSSNSLDMLAVLGKHYEVAKGLISINESNEIFRRVEQIWYEIDFSVGFRNSQATVIAPTGTISLIMDCETSGIEPYFSRSVTKKLIGGGTINFEYDGVEEEDCAVGENCLAPIYHLLMVAAAQPFISGGISKTVNLPHSATIADVDHVYRQAHKLGLKSISIYRDGSKLTQPLTAVVAESKTDKKKNVEKITPETKIKPVPALVQNHRGMREALPSRRPGYAQKLRIGDQALYLHTGEYTDGTLGEIFVTLNREGSTLRSLMECFSKAVSIGLQYGVPLSEFADAFISMRFEPAGIVRGDDRIRLCSSVVDLIFKHLAINYLKREDLAHTPTAQAAEAVAEIADELTIYLGKTAAETPRMVMFGEICQQCGEAALVRTGTCLTCRNCGANSGC